MATADPLRRLDRGRIGDEGRSAPDLATVGDVGDRRHDTDERVRVAARARVIPVAQRSPRGDRCRADRGTGDIAAGRPDREGATGTDGRSGCGAGGTGSGARAGATSTSEADAAARAEPSARAEPDLPPEPPERPKPRWFRDLKPARRKRAAELITRLRVLETEEAEEMARAEVVGGRPALARLALERKLREVAGRRRRRDGRLRPRSRSSSPGRKTSSIPDGASWTTGSVRSGHWTSGRIDRSSGPSGVAGQIFVPGLLGCVYGRFRRLGRCVHAQEGRPARRGVVERERANGRTTSPPTNIRRVRRRACRHVRPVLPPRR